MATANHEPLCSDCYEHFYFTCGRCDNIYPFDDGNTCDACADTWCTSCWQGHHSYSCRYHDASLCSACYERHESCDSDDDDAYAWLYRTCDTTTDAFLSSVAGQTLHTLRPFGVEIECYAPGVDALSEIASQFPQAVGISADGSLHGANGVEFQTPRMAGVTGEEQMKAIMKHLNDRGFTVNQSCGLHVHLDAADFMPADSATTEYMRMLALRELMTFYLSFEDVLLALLPQSRRTNSYCKAFKSAYAWEDLADAGSRTQLESLWYKAMDGDEVTRRKAQKQDASRYRGVNFHSLFSSGHLEIRYHSGTLNPRKILEWVNLHGRIMDKIADRTLAAHNVLFTLTLTEKITLFFSLLRLPEASQQYFEARIEKFNPGLADESLLCAA